MEKVKPGPQYRWLPSLAIIGWWLYDLQGQWRALVEYQYGWMVAILAGYLIWERWTANPPQDRPAPFWVFGLLVLAGTPFILLAEFYKQGIFNSPAASFSLSIGCALYLLANLLYARGWSCGRSMLFPLLFLFLAVPLPQILWNPIVLGLQKVITALDVETLNLVGIPAVQDANIIRLPNGNVGINEACSGVRSLQSSLMVALFLGSLLFRSRRIRVGLLLTGIFLALAGNYLRSFYLSFMAYHHGIEAVHRVHDVAGWSILLFTLVGLIIAVWCARKLENALARTKVEMAEVRGESP